MFGGYVNAVAHPRVEGDPWSAGLHRTGAWLRSGDRGARNPDGTIAFRGVIKPMFTRNGFNIYPREIERVVGEMPGVRGVRVTAAPEPLRENDIAITVVGDVSAADVKAWCDDRLAVYKRPSFITIEPVA